MASSIHTSTNLGPTEVSAPLRWRTLFVRDPHAGTRLSRADALRVGLLFGPAVCCLILLRLIQHTQVSTTGRYPLDSLLLHTAPPPFFILLVTVLLGLLARKTWPHVRTAWLMTGTLAISAGLFTITATVIPPWLAGWLSPRAFEVVRWDVLLLVGFALGSLLVLPRLSTGLRRLVLVLLHTLLAVLLLLPMAELGTIRALGMAPDWPMLAYTLRHLGELAPVLASEIGGAQIGLLLLPVGLVLMPLAVERLPAVRRYVRAIPQRPSEPSPWLLVGAVLPLVLVLVLPPSTPLPPTHRTISYAGMARSMFEHASVSPPRVTGLNEAAAPFDARSLYVSTTDSTRRMNVVIILLESFRRRSLTPYTPSLATTPFLDSLAQHSLLVEQLSAVVPYTNKSLAPILAGIYSRPRYLMPESEPGGLPGTGLPALLKPLGYRSAFFTPATLSFERKDQILANLGYEEMYGDGAFPTDGFFKTGYFGYEDRIILEPSLEWVDEVTTTDQPFLLTYLTLTAHHDYQLPPSFPKHQYVEHDEDLNNYLNALRYTDDVLRTLFRGFAQRGLLDSTLFILLGDHGEAFGEHGLRVHGDIIWEEALEVPALLYNPTLIPTGRRVEGPYQQIDVLPTVVDALGLRLEGGHLPGQSMLQPVAPGRTLYHHARNGDKILALRRDGKKFIYYHRTRPMEVYDLRTDPLERHDIAAQIPPEQRRAVEIELLLWRHGIDAIYDTSVQATAFAKQDS